MRTALVLFVFLFNTSFAQTEKLILLKPDRVFDGEAVHTGWSVLVRNDLIQQVGVIDNPPIEAEVINLPGTTLLPGLIEGHSHLFLHPYNETSWDDQVLKESRAERTARAVSHAKATLMAGFTTVRDLGTEGALYDDVGLKAAIEKGVIPGPRMLVATRAIVATGSYGPKYNAEIDLPKGAAEAGNADELVREVRTQIGKGADVIKIYADYRWGRNNEAMPTFSIEELTAAVNAAKSAGRQVVVHASTLEGMRRSIIAGVTTIEHGDEGTAEIFKLMKDRNVALCPTIAAGEATSQYRGWKKGTSPEPDRIVNKRRTFKFALQSGVSMCMGGDVGVFAHGDNAREMELMVEYGMKPTDVLRSGTSVNADVFGLATKVGRIKPGLLADMIAVKGNPTENISDVRNVTMVMKNGTFYRRD